MDKNEAQAYKKKITSQYTTDELKRRFAAREGDEMFIRAGVGYEFLMGIERI